MSFVAVGSWSSRRFGTRLLDPLHTTPRNERTHEQHSVPAGVLSVLTGGPEVGGALSNHADVDKISFTGSVPTGVKIMTAGALRCAWVHGWVGGWMDGHVAISEAWRDHHPPMGRTTSPDPVHPSTHDTRPLTAAKGIKNVTLELGGKSPALVFDSCDLARTVEWVMFGCFWTNGQICSATSRLLVQDTIYDAFVAKLVAETNKIRVGNPLAEGTKMGPIVNKAQYDKVLGFVARAQAEGATLAAGGAWPSEVGPGRKGYFLRPTILTDVAPHHEVWRTEVFGPVLAVRAFGTEAEALALANDSEYGLAGAVFSADDRQLDRVTEALRVGCVWRNCSQPCFSQLPWGGMKRSGIGRDLGREGFRSYLETKQVVTHVTENALGWYNVARL